MRLSHNEFDSRIGEGFSSINDGRGPDDCRAQYSLRVLLVVLSTVLPKTLPFTQFEYWIVVVAVVTLVLSPVLTGLQKTQSLQPFMSLGGGASSALDQAVERAIRSGVVFVVAAGMAMLTHVTLHREQRMRSLWVPQTLRIVVQVSPTTVLVLISSHQDLASSTCSSDSSTRSSGTNVSSCCRCGSSTS